MTFRLLAVSVIAAAATTLSTFGAATADEYKAGGITVAHPWARATPGGTTVGAAYFEIKAATGKPDTLVSAASPVAGRVEVHTHTQEDGVMKMRRLDALPIAAGSSVVLGPAGHHLMLFDLKQPLKEGDRIPVTLVFEKSGPVTLDVSIEPAGAKGPHGMDHQPGHDKAGNGSGSGAGHEGH
jgi:periplasmic copper chaperone A